MDHDGLVDQLLDRCKGFIEDILQAPDLHSVVNNAKCTQRRRRKTPPPRDRERDGDASGSPPASRVGSG